MIRQSQEGLFAIGIKVLLGDFIVAVINSPNQNGAKATFLSGVVTADEEITITPDVMPESADGLFDVIVIRAAF